MHFIDPARYPLAADAAYTPAPHPLWDAVNAKTALKMKNIVLVQPSIYGYNNSALLDALRGLGPSRSRGVVRFDATTISSTILQEWHVLGVRGVRLNIQSTNSAVNATSFATILKTYANLTRPFGCVLQAYIPMSLLTSLEPTIRDLGMDFCVDHFGQPFAPSRNSSSPTFDPYTSVPGFSSLISLLRTRRMWVKSSADYRVDLTAHGLEVVAKEILRVRPDRVVFAEKWPHTRSEGPDVRPFEERVLKWCEEAGAVEMVFETNAKYLFGVYGVEDGCEKARGIQHSAPARSYGLCVPGDKS